jgi:DNA-binding NarL/FixJ family response regulator
MNPARRCDVLLALGEAQLRLVLDVSEAPEGRDAFLRAAEIAQAIGSPDRLARAALGWAGFNPVRTHGGVQQARLLEDALAIAAPGDSALTARLMARLAFDCQVLDWPADRVLALCDEALAMARRLGDPGVLAETLVARLVATVGPHNAAEQAAAMEEARRHAEAAGDLRQVYWALVFGASSAYEAGVDINLDRAFDAALTVARQLQLPYFLWASALTRSGRAVQKGAYVDAEAILPTLGSDSEALVALYHRAIVLWSLRRDQGRPEAVESALRAAIEMTREHVCPFDRNRGEIAKLLLLIVLTETGRDDDARKAFEAHVDRQVAQLPLNTYWHGQVVLLADLCALLRDRARAAPLYDVLASYSEHNVRAGWGFAFLGPAAHYLGLLAALLSRWEAAERHFEQALAMNARMSARPALARTQQAYAAMLLQRAAPGDRKRARELLEQACATADELGMTGLASQVAALLATTDPAVLPPTEPLSYGLSARELEVLRLIAGGQPDREIAAALYISPRTVSTHVSHIFTKLDLNNRAEAAAFAVRHGLV